MMPNDPEVQRQYQEAMINTRKYPDGYKGPKAGQSEDAEWVAVRDYQAYLWMTDGTWTYSDFDCYLHTMCRHHYKLGEEAALNALKEFQKRYNIKTEVKSWYDKN